MNRRNGWDSARPARSGTRLRKSRKHQRPEGGSSRKKCQRSPGTSYPESALRLIQQGRISTGMSELDQVLGGGIVPGSLVLVGGDPGIGKSTLLLQVCRESGRAA